MNSISTPSQSTVFKNQNPTSYREGIWIDIIYSYPVKFYGYTT